MIDKEYFDGLNNANKAMVCMMFMGYHFNNKVLLNGNGVPVTVSQDKSGVIQHWFRFPKNIFKRKVGCVSVHRYAAFLKFGKEILNKNVHVEFKDGEKSNLSYDNIIIYNNTYENKITKDNLLDVIEKGYSLDKILKHFNITNGAFYNFCHKNDIMISDLRKKILLPDKFCKNCKEKMDKRNKFFCSTDCRVKHEFNNKTLPDIMSGNASSYTIKKYLIRLNPNCSICGLGEFWQGQKLTLQLDHIDGNNKNNNIKNCRILCPNCHTQTPTYGMKTRI